MSTTEAASTTEVTSWAIDIAPVGPIYPFVGSEGLLFILGLIFWVAFHIVQLRRENKSYDDAETELEKPGALDLAMKERKMAGDE
jgi:hypothetical protein